MAYIAAVFAAFTGLTLTRLCYWFFKDLVDEGDEVAFSPRIWFAHLLTSVVILLLAFAQVRLNDERDWFYDPTEDLPLFAGCVLTAGTWLYLTEGRKSSFVLDIVSCGIAILITNLVMDWYDPAKSLALVDRQEVVMDGKAEDR